MKTKSTTCLETLVQQEMQNLCKKFNIKFTEKYYTENREMYTTYVIGKLQQKHSTAQKINTMKIKLTKHIQLVVDIKSHYLYIGVIRFTTKKNVKDYGYNDWINVRDGYAGNEWTYETTTKNTTEL